MRDLLIEEYREYNLLADDQKEARAREMFLEMMEISNSMQPQTAADFQNSPIKQALESLRVNGKPLFDEENPVSLENYTVRIREAMDRIAPAMENPSAIKVPYCQAPDGSCQAIKPGTDMTPVTTPRRPAWYKRWFKGIVPSWRKEVTDYEKTVRHIEDQQTIPSYQDVLEERAEKRTLQSAVLNSRGAINKFCDEISMQCFGQDCDSLLTVFRAGAGFTNIGRGNVLSGFALGLAMADLGRSFDEALRLSDREKEYYGNLFSTVYQDFEQIGKAMKTVTEKKEVPDHIPEGLQEGVPNTPDEELTEEQRQSYIQALTKEFKDKVAPYILMAVSAYSKETIQPVDYSDPESIRTVGFRNQLLTSYGQGIVQMVRNSMSANTRLPLRTAYGELIQERAAALANERFLSPEEKAIMAFASSKLPEGGLTPGDFDANTRKALDSVDYSLIALDGITRANSIQNFGSYKELHNSTIEGSLFQGKEEISFGMTTFNNVCTKQVGLSTMPQQLSSQYSQPFYENAYVRREAYDIYAKRYDVPLNTSEDLKRVMENTRQGTPRVGMEEVWDASDQEYLQKVEDMEKQRLRLQGGESRRRTNFQTLSEHENSHSRRPSVREQIQPQPQRSAAQKPPTRR